MNGPGGQGIGGPQCSITQAGLFVIPTIASGLETSVTEPYAVNVGLT
jgi:hypothetical protein